MQYDLSIINGRLVYKDQVFKGHIGVKNGKIAIITNRKDMLFNAKKIIDANDNYILPGLIDSHVHFRTPGLTYKETWKTASRAAVAGGVTTVLDMPNTNPYLSKVDLIDEKNNLIKGTSLVDYGFHFGVEPGKSYYLNLLNSNMIASVKVFLTGHHTAKNIIKDRTELEEIFRIAAQKNIILTLHAEDEDTLNLFRQYNNAPTNLIEYERHLSRSAGIIAIGKAIELVKQYGTQVHVLHVSSAEEVELLEVAAKAGYPITFETTPHQLWFDAMKDVELGSRVKLSPAIRCEKDQLKLWKSLINGTMISVGSDHAPHSNVEKKRDFYEAPPGLPGVQEILPVLITGLMKNYPDLTFEEILSKVVSVMAEGPSKLFKISDRKGRIEEGLDADFTIIDPEDEWVVKKEDIYSLCQWSAYEGETLKGRPFMTIRRGKVVYLNGEFGEADGKLLTFKEFDPSKFNEFMSSPFQQLNKMKAFRRTNIL
ncbi:dihydroorotase [Priestia aryabhattai]|uniref:dihydroorotase n=1 Tax=Priestia aryabhattai TaxID=412384 RepID=UPI001FB44759|nr:dihydroorotase family protein [Priestia aryabhattai]